MVSNSFNFLEEYSMILNKLTIFLWLGAGPLSVDSIIYSKISNEEEES